MVKLTSISVAASPITITLSPSDEKGLPLLS